MTFVLPDQPMQLRRGGTVSIRLMHPIPEISRARVQAVCLAILCLLLATRSPADDVRHEYRASVDAGLQRLDVEARFGSPQRRLVARSPLAAQVLAQAEDCDGRPLRISGRRIDLQGPSYDCLRYSVDLVRAAGEDGITVSALRVELGTSRKYAVPLVEWMDREGLTRRRDDLRFPR